MEVTEARIKLMTGRREPGDNDRLRAFASFTIDDMFVVRDLRIVEGAKGLFVAMPSKKLTDRCGGCGTKNHLRARYCDHCGARLDPDRAPREAGGRANLHADVAHPISSDAREMIQDAVLEMYYDELELAKQPGYVSRYLDFDGDDDEPARAEASVA